MSKGRRPLCAKEACIMAVGALDDLVNELVKASCLKIAPEFLDWIADEATPLVERYVARSFTSQRFADSLGVGDPCIALARWVRHWVGPWIVMNFDQLAVHLPEFAQSRPGGLRSLVARKTQPPQLQTRCHARFLPQPRLSFAGPTL